MTFSKSSLSHEVTLIETSEKKTPIKFDESSVIPQQALNFQLVSNMHPKASRTGCDLSCLDSFAYGKSRTERTGIGNSEFLSFPVFFKYRLG